MNVRRAVSLLGVLCLVAACASTPSRMTTCPRTIASIHGASASTCAYMKVACTPPRTVTAFGWISFAIFKSSSAL